MFQSRCAVILNDCQSICGFMLKIFADKEAELFLEKKFDRRQGADGRNEKSPSFA